MSSARDASVIAREMIAAHGERAGAIAEERAVERMRSSDPESAALWLRVARAVRAHSSAATAARPFE